MDQYGYAMSGTAFLLMIPLVIVGLMIINLSVLHCRIDEAQEISWSAGGAALDIKRNIPVETRAALNETVLEFSHFNSYPGKKMLIGKVQNRMNRVCSSYGNIKAFCTIKSIESVEDDPFYLEINATISIESENLKHCENISQRVSIEGLPDPLPLRILGNSIDYDTERINYTDALAAYLMSKGCENPEVYINATGPHIIKRCPYEPYTSHNSTEILENCIENGYYHESNDGACYLCRLEGKSVCPHQGIETFILPRGPSDTAVVSVDHVLFSQPFNGSLIQIAGFILYLDEGHRIKYGICV